MLFRRRKCRANNIDVLVHFETDGPHACALDLCFDRRDPDHIRLTVFNNHGHLNGLPESRGARVEREKLAFSLANRRPTRGNGAIICSDYDQKNTLKISIFEPGFETAVLVIGRIPARKLTRFLRRTEHILPIARSHEMIAAPSRSTKS